MRTHVHWRIAWMLAAVFVALEPRPGRAIDHGNLDAGRPLRIEDAYPIAAGEWVVETGVGYTNDRNSPDHVLFPIEIAFGVAPNLEARIGTTLQTNPGSVEDASKSGDLHLSGLYNFNQETLRMPAFGVRATLNVPTGVDSSGTDGEVKAIVTKSIDRLTLHFNAAYELASGGGRAERDGRYEFVVGASYPLGAPKHTRTLLLADLFAEQSPLQGDSNVYGAGLGMRYQLLERIVLDFGLGSEFAGPAERASFFATGGVSVGF